MSQQTEIEKRGSDVAAGDLILAGGRAHRITRMDAYPEFYKVCPDLTARIAICDTGFEMTVVDQGWTRIAA